jgi:hypothetical protein
MPTRKELMEQCKARGLHGYSRKSKQELEVLLAPQEPELESNLPEQGHDTNAEVTATEQTDPTEPAETPNTTIPLCTWTRAWISVCLGIPPYLLPYIKSPPPNR